MDLIRDGLKQAAATDKPILTKEVVMKDAFSTPRNRTITLILLAVCCLSAIAAILVGIDDNLPGILLAFLAAIMFVLAFAHPWRTARKFILLFLASVLGLVLFIVLSISSDLAVQNPNTSIAVKNLILSSFMETMTIIIAMVCPAAFLVGLVGSIVMFIRNRRRLHESTDQSTGMMGD